MIREDYFVKWSVRGGPNRQAWAASLAQEWEALRDDGAPILDRSGEEDLANHIYRSIGAAAGLLCRFAAGAAVASADGGTGSAPAAGAGLK